MFGQLANQQPKDEFLMIYWCSHYASTKMKGHSTLWASNVPFLTTKMCPLPFDYFKHHLKYLTTLSNHLKYLARQGFTGFFDVMNLIMHPQPKFWQEH